MVDEIDNDEQDDFDDEQYDSDDEQEHIPTTHRFTTIEINVSLGNCSNIIHSIMIYLKVKIL